MLKKVVALLLLVVGLSLTFGCASHTGLSPTQNLRRVMIMGEQIKLSAEDLQREVDLDQYPRAGRWNY